MSRTMKRLLALVFGALLFATPALAAWGTPVQRGTNQVSSNHTLNITSVTCNANNLCIAAGHGKTAAGTDTINISDPGGNTWTKYQCPYTAGNVDISFIFWTVPSVTISGTISITDDAASTFVAAAASIVEQSGQDPVSPEDTAARACSGSTTGTTSPSTTSGSPSTSDEWAISPWGSGSNATGNGYTVDTTHSWSPTGGYGTGNTAVVELTAWKENVASSSPMINSPTTASRAYAQPMMLFKLNGATPTAVCTLLTTGIGSC